MHYFTFIALCLPLFYLDVHLDGTITHPIKLYRSLTAKNGLSKAMCSVPKHNRYLGFNYEKWSRTIPQAGYKGRQVFVGYSSQGLLPPSQKQPTTQKIK